MMTVDSNEVKPPFLAQVWLDMYYATPKVYFPGTKLDFGFMLACVAVLNAVRLILESVFLAFGWPSGKITQEAATCATGIFHSLNLVPVLFLLLWSFPFRPSARMHEYPRWWQDAVHAMIQLCCGHMIHDTIFGVLLLRWENGAGLVLGTMDAIYLGHHVGTFVYMMSNRIMGVGQTAAIMCMFMGEFTNPTYNAYTITLMAKPLACCQGPLALKIMSAIELANAILMVLFRGILFVPFSARISYSFAFTKAGSEISIVARTLWNVVMWGVVFGSAPFIPEFLEVIQAHLFEKSQDQEL